MKIQFFGAHKATHLSGEMDSEEAMLLWPQPARPSSAVLNDYHLIISSPGFHEPNRMCKRCSRANARQAVKSRAAGFSGVKEKLDRVHSETQHTQEFTVGLIKPMKSRALKQQAQPSEGKHWKEERQEPVKVLNEQQAERENITQCFPVIMNCYLVNTCALDLATSKGNTWVLNQCCT